MGSEMCIRDSRSIADCARRMVDVARRGLERRGEESPERALGPLYRRIEERRSPAEDLLREYRRGGVQALLACARIGGPGVTRVPGRVPELVPDA